ncbi:MAG: hypothetical protein ACSHXY_02635 [Alphaproteobacteria bacterium]
MKTIHKIMTAGAMLVAAISSSSASDQTETQAAPVLKPLQVAMTDGTYAGTFLCSLGEMGMTLTLKDVGAAVSAEDIGQGHCKTGAGPCNDKQNQEISRSRKVTGVINFFPTVGNPKAPKGAFEVSGAVNYASKYLTKFSVVPGKWLDEPEGFGASGMTGTIYNYKISGKPTAPGCHDLTLTKIQTWSK